MTLVLRPYCFVPPGKNSFNTKNTKVALWVQYLFFVNFVFSVSFVLNIRRF